jgi:phosphocarrier protein HPr
MSQDDTRPARCRIEILNGLGLHLRPAQKFVQIASQYRSEIRVQRAGEEASGEEIDGKSILSLAMLAAEQGTILEIVARGPDADAAIAALLALATARFYEDDDGQSTERAP